MIHSLYFTADGQLRTDLSEEEFKAALLDPLGLLWVDFEETPAALDEKVLINVFGFHPLAVDDALQETHVPKVDDWTSYLYIVLSAVIFEKKDNSMLDTQELDVFLGKNYMVTHHDKPIAAVQRVWSSVQRDDRHLRRGADHLLYRLVDEVVSQFMPVVDEIDDEIDKIEDEIFNNPGPEILERIFDLKRAILQLRRMIDPQREVLNRLARDDYEVIDSRERVYFRDVYDHLVRLHDLIESLRDLIGGALDTYLSVINNRMNDIMKTLTVITTMFMPISFVVGFFGMNYFLPVARTDAWTAMPSFIFTLTVLVLVPVGMFFWIRRRGWM
jgi:magnesium transporter